MSALSTTKRLISQTIKRGTAPHRPIHSTASLPQKYQNITETVGNTPVVRINKLCPNPTVSLYAKCEFFNPLSSVKDRLAVAIIEHAEKNGTLKPGQTVVEATSGNTGIALAMVCAQRGYPLVVTMAESFSVERRKTMRMLGARVVVTPKEEKGTGMVNKAKELAQEHGWFFARQFENEANPAYHANTTGPEILLDFKGENLDYWVTGYGTGGTFQGAGKVLKQARPDIKIVLSEPEEAQLLASGIEQERFEDGSPSKSHPAFKPHPIQGWTPDFIPQVLQDGLALDLVDDIIPISGKESIETALKLARMEGIFTGISGGATMATALKLAEKAEDGATILAMLPDTAERYMTTPLYGSILEDMNDEEVEVSKSTPGYQMADKV